MESIFKMKKHTHEDLEMEMRENDKEFSFRTNLLLGVCFSLLVLFLIGFIVQGIALKNHKEIISQMPKKVCESTTETIITISVESENIFLQPYVDGEIECDDKISYYYSHPFIIFWNDGFSVGECRIVKIEEVCRIE